MREMAKSLSEKSAQRKAAAGAGGGDTAAVPRGQVGRFFDDSGLGQKKRKRSEQEEGDAGDGERREKKKSKAKKGLLDD